MNYQIIKDEAALKEFIAWLPDCSEIEQFYVTLFARKKYCTDPAVKYDKTQIKRFTSTKDRLFRKIMQLECPVGAYVGESDLPIPQEALALYININPRSFRKVWTRGIYAFADAIEKGLNKNPRQEIMSVIQNAPGTKHFHVFDIDTRNLGIIEQCKEIVAGDGFPPSVIQTRGGYHLLVPQNSISYIKEKNWYVKLKQFSDVTGDCLSPVPGCVQGDFVPKLIA